MSGTRQGAGSSLTLRLTAVLAFGAMLLSFLVTMAAAEGTREQRLAELHRRHEEACASIARRAAPLLERGDDLRLSVLATSVAEMIDGRVLMVDGGGRVRLDTGLGLGGETLGLETSDGLLRRALDPDGLNWEVLAPALGHDGGAGEVRIRYRLEATQQAAFPWSLFGLVLLCSLSLITLACWIAHSWVQRVRMLARQAQSMARGDLSAVGAERLDGRGGAVAELEDAVRELGAARDDAAQHARAACLDLAREVVHALELRGHVPVGHPERVRQRALDFASELGLAPADREDLAAAGALLDLGKAGVRPSALTKVTGLDELERESLRQHPTRGAGLLAALPGLEGVAQAIRHQHEKWDGGGFPEGLRGDRIPLSSRILAIASAYEGMVHGGVHGRPMTWPDALDRLREDRGEHFDPALVDAFEALVRRDPPRSDRGVTISQSGVVPYRVLHGEPRQEQPVFEDEAVEDILSSSETELEVVFYEDGPEGGR
jgi:HD-GYP domain-containing protein (c-di-GMP phosphodiesterase class II)